MPDCIEMPYTPQVREGRITDKGCRYRLGGNSCLAGDFVGDYYFEHGLFIGDEVVFLDMAHYTTVKTHFFNGVHHPSVYLQHTDGTYSCLKSFGYIQTINLGFEMPKLIILYARLLFCVEIVTVD